MSDFSQHITTTQTTHCCPHHERPHRVVEYRRQKEIDYLCYAAWLLNVRILVLHVPDNILLNFWFGYSQIPCFHQCRDGRKQ